MDDGSYNTNSLLHADTDESRGAEGVDPWNAGHTSPEVSLLAEGIRDALEVGGEDATSAVTPPRPARGPTGTEASGRDASQNSAAHLDVPSPAGCQWRHAAEAPRGDAGGVLAEPNWCHEHRGVDQAKAPTGVLPERALATPTLSYDASHLGDGGGFSTNNPDTIARGDDAWHDATGSNWCPWHRALEAQNGVAGWSWTELNWRAQHPDVFYTWTSAWPNGAHAYDVPTPLQIQHWDSSRCASSG